jgi:hypothetical protein
MSYFCHQNPLTYQHNMKFSLSKNSNYPKHRLAFWLLLSCACFCMPSTLWASGPCDATTWTGTSGGIVACGNAAATQPNISNSGTYDPAILPITLGNCVDFDNGGTSAGLTPPTDGQAIKWFNFNVQPFAHNFQYQIVSNDNLGWAVYYSTNPSESGGDCSQLQYLSCGFDPSNGWLPPTNFNTPNFTQWTNYYMAVWDQDGGNFEFTFKARHGCGDAANAGCYVELAGEPTTTCSADNSTYTVNINIQGVNGTYQVSGNGSLSVAAPVTLTNIAATPPITSGTLSITFPASQSTYTVAVNGVSGTTCSIAGITGNAPVCDPCLSDPYPTLTPAQDLTLNCNSNTTTAIANWLATHGGASATDNGTVTWSHNYSGGLLMDCSGTGSTLVTFTATDDCNHIATTNATLTVTDNINPTINCPNNLILDCNNSNNPVLVSEWLDSATASDECSGALPVSYNYNSATLLNACSGSPISITFTATDACGNSATCARTISIGDNTAPTINCPDDLTLLCGNANNSTLLNNWLNSATASDNCSGTVNITHNYSNNLPQDCNNDGLGITFTATDACGNTASCIASIYLDDNANPTFTTFPIDLLLACDENLPNVDMSQVTANDNCGTATISYMGEQSYTEGCQIVTERSFRATDICGNSLERVQEIRQNGSGTITLTNVPADYDFGCVPSDPPLPIPTPESITATSSCGGTVSVTHQGDEVISNGCNRTVKRTYRASSNCSSNYIDRVQTFTYRNDGGGPEFVKFPEDISLYGCTAEIPPILDYPDIIANDACGGTVTYTHTGDQTTVNGNTTTIIRSYTATDICGLSTTQSQSISYNNNIPPPVFTAFPPNINLGCNPPVIPAPNTAMVGVPSGVTVIHVSDTPIDINCAHTIQRVYRAINGCEQVSEQTQLINYKTDTTPPIIVQCPNNQTLACGASLPPANTNLVQATDNCGAVTVVHIGDQTSTNGTITTTTRTYLATDACNNSTPCTQIFTQNGNACCFANAGILVASTPICPTEFISANATFSIPTNAEYSYYYLLVNSNNNQIIEVSQATNGQNHTFMTQTPGTYYVYGLMVKSNTPSTTGYNPPALGANMVNLQNIPAGICANFSPQFISPIKVLPELNLYSTGENISEGNGGIMPVAYNVHEFYVFGGIVPYQFTWDNLGYVRYDIAYTTSTGNESADIPAGLTGVMVTVHYSDNATWRVTVSSSDECSSDSVHLGNDTPTQETGGILDIDDYSIKPQSSNANDGAIRLCVSGGDPDCIPSYQWAGPDTWNGGQLLLSANSTSGTGPDTYSCGSNMNTTYLSNLVSGWYNVTVSCGSEVTEGWYWVPNERRGRSKSDEPEFIATPDIDATSNIISLKIYPNPARSSTTIQFGLLHSDIAEVAVYSIDGRLISQLYNNHAEAKQIYKMVYDTNALIEGIYMVRVKTRKGVEMSGRLVKTDL